MNTDSTPQNGAAAPICVQLAGGLLLNDMADEGWVVDHVIPSEFTVVFRR